MTSAAVAERSAAVAGTVVMTEQEARRIIDQIRERMENVRAKMLALYEGEAWTALGYATFVEMAKVEFSASKSQAYRLLNAARLDKILSPIGEQGVLPESHLRELVPVIDEPDTVIAIVEKVQEEKGDEAQADDYRFELNEHFADTARVVRGNQPPRPVNPNRKSVSSRAERGDFADDAPDYADESQEARPAGPVERFCSDCGGKYRGERCPCAATVEVEVEPAPARTIGYHEPAVAEIVVSTPASSTVLDDDLIPAPKTIQDFKDLVGERLTAYERQGLTGWLVKQLDQSAIRGVHLFTKTLLVPEDATPLSRYADEMVSILALTEVPPVAVVSMVDVERLGAMREQHAVIRKWLADLDYQIFLTEQKAAKQGAA